MVSGLKLVWRIVSAPSSLWVSWLRTYLIRKSSFWAIKNSTQAGSWMWRKLLKLRPITQHFCKVEVHSGKHISFWYDSWSTWGRLHDKLGSRGFIDLGITEHASVEEVLLTHRRRRHKNSFLNELEEFIARKKADRVADQCDVVLWSQKANDFKAKFSSNRTWLQLRQEQPKQQWVKCIWFTNMTPKHAFLTWLAAQNRLSTGDRTQHWNHAGQSQCVLCSHPLETRDHLFFECIYAAEVWKGLVTGLLQHLFSTKWSDILVYIQNNSMDYSHNFILKYAFQAVVYGIWRERNLRKHGEKPSPPSRMIKLIEKNIRNRLSTARMVDEKLAGSLMLWFSFQV